MRVQVKFGNLKKVGGLYQYHSPGCDNCTVIFQDVCTGKNWVKGTWGLSVLFLTSVCESTIISVKVQLKYLTYYKIC